MTKVFNKKFKKSSKQWIVRQIRDEFNKQKRIQGYRSRSAFKLLEIEKKFKILKNNCSALDLGSSPGGWSQVLAKKIKKGKIIAVDKLPMQKINNVNFILGDFFNEYTNNKIFKLINSKIDIILSDMSANTTGNKHLDSYKNAEINFNLIESSKIFLNKNGVLLSKIFMGSEFKEIEKKASINFKKVIFFKPNSSRKESRELYMLCKNIIN